MKLWVKIVIGAIIILTTSFFIFQQFYVTSLYDDYDDYDYINNNKGKYCEIDEDCYVKDNEITGANTGQPMSSEEITIPTKLDCIDNTCMVIPIIAANRMFPINLAQSLTYSIGESDVGSSVAFYNENKNKVYATVDIINCRNPEYEFLPLNIESYNIEVMPNQSQVFPFYLSFDIEPVENIYICTLSVVNSNEPEMIYESKQFFLRVNE